MARLLLIEDEPDICTLLERYLRRTGFLVTATADGESGIKSFESGIFDVVVTDGLLPKKTGIEVVAALRASPRGRDVPIVMITAAFKTPRARKDALEGGVDAFFTKPFVLTDLKDKLVELLHRQGKTIGPPPPPPRGAGPSSSSGSGRPPSSPPTAAPLAPPPPIWPRRVDTAAGAARALLDAAADRLSGVLRFSDGSSRLDVAFLRGVVVGASDNLREHLLGERLWKEGRLTTEQMRALNARIAEKNERVAEALLALGLCTADEALGFVDEQALMRVRRALLWTGEVERVDDEPLAQRLAVTSLDVAEVILAFGGEAAQETDALRFVALHKQKRLERGPRFDDLLLALSRARPQSALPAVFFAGSPTVAEAARSSTPLDVWAAWLVGLCRLADDPPGDPRPLPDLLKSGVVGMRMDKELAGRICAFLLRARGRTFYEVLELPADVTSSVALERVAALTAELGPDPHLDRALGPALPAARELWALLDDARATFASDAAREAYDGALAPKAAPAPAGGDQGRDQARDQARKQASLEDSFLRGQQALASGELVLALGCFELALASRPDDTEYESYLGWTQVLTGDEPGGIQRLMGAMRRHPQAMRPLFFLALCAARSGDTDKARSLLEECVRRSPHDVEVRTALEAMGGPLIRG